MSTGPGADLPPPAGRAVHHGPVVAVTLLAAVYAGLASGARPFTVPADVAVSVPSALFAGILVLQRVRPAGPWRRLDPMRPEPGGTALPWALVIALLVAVELADYFHGGPRADYPTISSGLDGLYHDRAVKAAVWFVWLTAGLHLTRR
ncbi:MAG TPA: hypothetical protein VND62_05050 [Acidimicrobiales bacterium]|nr:hypothetical protein [Acidimicrobiales bacterium]